MAVSKFKQHRSWRNLVEMSNVHSLVAKGVNIGSKRLGKFVTKCLEARDG